MSDIFSIGASLLPSIVSNFGPLIGDAAAPYAMLTTPGQNIGGIFPNVVIEEVHRDEQTITQHPVEYGTPISDHAFMQPPTVQMHCSWSDCSAQSVGYVDMVYATLQALQKSAQPFNMDCTKRSYSNMLIRSLYVKNDDKTDSALDVIALCQNVLIVQSATTSAASASGLSDGNQPAASQGTDGSTSDMLGDADTPPSGSMTQAYVGGGASSYMNTVPGDGGGSIVTTSNSISSTGTVSAVSAPATAPAAP